jgi:hypothetical protein
MNSTADRTRLAILALWLGIMAYFSLVVAPIAFAVLGDPRLAGNIVSRNLAVTEGVGIVLGLILLTITLRQVASGGRAGRFDQANLAILIGMTAMMVVSKFLVSARLHQIRIEYGERLASLAATDPVRTSFNSLHQVSVWLMGLTMIGAVIMVVRLIRIRQG